MLARPLLVALLFVLVAAFAVASDLDEGRHGVAEARLVGRSELAFDWSKSPCESLVSPDAPARAFRDYRGRTQLILSRFVNARMIGKDLLDLKPSCRPILKSQYNPDPAQFSDKQWITAPYTKDGRTIYSLVHNEYHGWEHVGMCSKQTTTVVLECWYNAIKLAVSTDGGRTFASGAPEADLVATTPYRYEPGAGPMGLFLPSNIVYRPSDGYYYALVLAARYKKQDRGVCVMRTRRLEDAGSWRAWGGEAFDVEFVDPYRTADNPSEHVCAPVAEDRISGMTSSLTYNTFFEKYLLVGLAASRPRQRRKPVWGIYFSLSDDLVHWTDRRLIVEAELVQTFRCGDRNPILHPSILDPDSRSRNYSTTDKRSYLFFMRANYKRCRPSPDLDLVRVPIEFSK